MYTLVELLDEHVHVVAPPVSLLHESIVVAPELVVIGDGLSCHWVRIEVVVDVKPVHVVATDDVSHYVADVVAALGHAGIQDVLPVVLEHPFRMPHGDMRPGELFRCLGLCPVRIDPRVNFHSSLMALRHHPCERIPKGRRRQSLRACKEPAPRLEVALVEGIALWSDLKDDGIHSVFLQFVELKPQRPLHLFRSHTDPLSVDGLNPSSPEIAFVLSLDAECASRHKQYHQQTVNILFLHHDNCFISE